MVPPFFNASLTLRLRACQGLGCIAPSHRGGNRAADH